MTFNSENKVAVIDFLPLRVTFYVFRGPTFLVIRIEERLEPLKVFYKFPMYFRLSFRLNVFPHLRDHLILQIKL